MLLSRRIGSITRWLAAVVPSLALLGAAPSATAMPAAPQGAQLLMLGTAGGPTLRKARAEPSTLLIVDGSAYLIDCGVGALRRMVEAGVDPASVKTIFITHHHPDHDLDLANIMANDFLNIGWANDGGAKYNVYGPPGTVDLVDAAVRYFAVPYRVFAEEGLGGNIQSDFVGKIRSHFDAHDVAGAGLVYQDKNIRVTAIENSHFVLMPQTYRAAERSYAYRIETPYGVIVITGDTGPSDAVARFAQGADVLVSEVMDQDAMAKILGVAAVAGHWSADMKAAAGAHMRQEHSAPDVVAHLATAAQAKSVLLYHFGPEADRGDDAVKAVIAGVQAGYKGQVVAAHDLDRYCIAVERGKGPALTDCR